MESFLLRFRLYRFLDAFKLVGVIFVLLFTHHGLNPVQISFLIGIWSVTQLLFEVPFGALADQYPRRNLLILALFLQLLGFLLWIRGGFLFYALGFVLWGLKNALVSGTQEAYVYDELKAQGQTERYEQVNGQLESAFWLGLTLSAVVGGVVAQYSYLATLYASITTTLLAMLILYTLNSIGPSRSTNERHYFSIIRAALQELRHNPSLWGIMLFFCVIFATYGAADEYWSLIYLALSLPVSVVGLLIAVSYSFFVLAGWTLPLFQSRFLAGREHYLLVVSALLFVISGLLANPYSLPLIFLAMYFFKTAHLKFDAKFQHSISSPQRATLSSLKSLVFELIYLGFVLVFGVVAARLGSLAILATLGGLLLFWLLVFKVFFPATLRRILTTQG